jgi:glycerol-3-phosphate acyltransferase PlsX
MPSMTGACALCDMGANVEVSPAMLAQFGLLAAVYAQVTQRKSRPRLGILANGEEASKGTELTRGAHALLEKLAVAGAPFEWKGYVEGRDIFGGEVDAVATDGFTGNVVLKTTEGAALAMMELLKRAFTSSTRAKLAALLARPALQEFKKRIDYAETGGAPLVGVNGLVMVCHGRSTGTALANAVKRAATYADQGLTAAVAAALARHAGDLGTAAANEESA